MAGWLTPALHEYKASVESAYADANKHVFLDQNSKSPPWWDPCNELVYTYHINMYNFLET